MRWLKIARCATTDWLPQLMLTVQFVVFCFCCFGDFFFFSFSTMFSSVKVYKMHWKRKQIRQVFLFSFYYILFNPNEWACFKTDYNKTDRCYWCCFVGVAAIQLIMYTCDRQCVCVCVNRNKGKNEEEEEITTIAAGAHQQLIYKMWNMKTKQKHTWTWMLEGDRKGAIKLKYVNFYVIACDWCMYIFQCCSLFFMSWWWIYMVCACICKWLRILFLSVCLVRLSTMRLQSANE